MVAQLQSPFYVIALLTGQCGCKKGIYYPTAENIIQIISKTTTKLYSDIVD